MPLDHMAILSDGLYPTSPADTTERHEYIVSRGLFINFPGFVEPVASLFNTMLSIGRAGISFARGLFRIG